MQYGSSVEEALNRMKERVPSEDLDLMIQAIVIQRQVGGNLAVVLEKLCSRFESELKSKVKLKHSRHKVKCQVLLLDYYQLV